MNMNLSASILSLSLRESRPLRAGEVPLRPNRTYFYIEITPVVKGFRPVPAVIGRKRLG